MDQILNNQYAKNDDELNNVLCKLYYVSLIKRCMRHESEYDADMTI